MKNETTIEVHRMWINNRTTIKVQNGYAEEATHGGAEMQRK